MKAITIQLARSEPEDAEDLARQQRREILAGFAASPEWAALYRDDTPRWTEHMLKELWACAVQPAELLPDLLALLFWDMYAVAADARPRDAPDIVGELRAYFAYATRVLDHPHAAGCLAVMSRRNLAEDLRATIAYARRQRRKTRLIRKR